MLHICNNDVAKIMGVATTTTTTLRGGHRDSNHHYYRYSIVARTYALATYPRTKTARA